MASLKTFPHWEALTATTRLAYEKSATLPFIGEFYLAGGTATAIHLGHRFSEDLDFFSTEQQVDDPLRSIIKERFTHKTFRVLNDHDDTFVCVWREIGVSFFRLQPYPLILPPVEVDGIRLASLEDIGAMKLAALISRAARKDLIDLYFIMKQVPIERLYEVAAIKYKSVSTFAITSLRGLGYTRDAEETPMPRMIKPIKWETMKNFLEQQAYQATRNHVERLWK